MVLVQDDGPLVSSEIILCVLRAQRPNRRGLEPQVVSIVTPRLPAGRLRATLDAFGRRATRQSRRTPTRR
jgi:hypothetical protein